MDADESASGERILTGSCVIASPHQPIACGWMLMRARAASRPSRARHHRTCSHMPPMHVCASLMGTACALRVQARRRGDDGAHRRAVDTRARPRRRERRGVGGVGEAVGALRRGGGARPRARGARVGPRRGPCLAARTCTPCVMRMHPMRVCTRTRTPCVYARAHPHVHGMGMACAWHVPTGG